MKWSNGYADATHLLNALDSFDSYSPFCRAFYRLILEWVENSPTEVVNLYDIYNRFLLAELEHHQALRDANLHDAADLPEWAMIYGQKAADLHKTLARLASLEDCSGSVAVVRHLLCAECFYQLGRVDLVVVSLDAAIIEGCDRPLLHFSLGYNLYMRAIKYYTSFDPGSGSQVVQDPLNFEQECRRAVEAMRRGLVNGPFDAQLHWWMGSILENVKDIREARKAYLRAADLDPDSYGETSRERLRALSPPVPEAVSDDERVRLSAMGEITVDEILDAFQYVETVSDLMAQDRTPLGGRSLQNRDL